MNETRFFPKKKLSPIYLGPKNLDTILIHWMSVKLADKFSDSQAFMAVPVSYYMSLSYYYRGVNFVFNKFDFLHSDIQDQ